MPFPTVRGPRCWVVAAVLTGLLAGCGGDKQFGPKEFAEERQHILKAAALVREYKTRNHNKVPADAEELKKFLKSLKSEDLKRLEVDDLDKALVSTRDKQPYQMAPPEVSSNPMQRGMQSVVVYEKVGVGGKHWTASSMGSTTEMDVARLKQVVPSFSK